jgi:hypothetical protein
MTRHAVPGECSHRPAWRVGLALLALLALLAGIVFMALRQGAITAPSAQRVATRPDAPPMTRLLDAMPTAMPAVTASESPHSPLQATAIRHDRRAVTQAAHLPYRFIGKSTTGAETSVVLFGRGRTVTLRGPGPLDDDYLVEGMFDEYLVIRHLPTGAGHFLPLVQRLQVIGPPADPEESPRD